GAERLSLEDLEPVDEAAGPAQRGLLAEARARIAGVAERARQGGEAQRERRPVVEHLCLPRPQTGEQRRERRCAGARSGDGAAAPRSLAREGVEVWSERRDRRSGA